MSQKPQRTGLDLATAAPQCVNIPENCVILLNLLLSQTVRPPIKSQIIQRRKTQSCLDFHGEDIDSVTSEHFLHEKL